MVLYYIKSHYTKTCIGVSYKGEVSEIYKRGSKTINSYCNINHHWWFLLLSCFLVSCPPYTVSSVRIFHLHLTICQKEVDSRCEKLVILLGSSTFKNLLLGQVWFLSSFFAGKLRQTFLCGPMVSAHNKKNLYIQGSLVQCCTH